LVSRWGLNLGSVASLEFRFLDLSAVAVDAFFLFLSLVYNIYCHRTPVIACSPTPPSSTHYHHPKNVPRPPIHHFLFGLGLGLLACSVVFSSPLSPLRTRHHTRILILSDMPRIHMYTSIHPESRFSSIFSWAVWLLSSMYGFSFFLIYGLASLFVHSLCVIIIFCLCLSSLSLIFFGNCHFLESITTIITLHALKPSCRHYYCEVTFLY
jgi:hypothetical protein